MFKSAVAVLALLTGAALGQSSAAAAPSGAAATNGTLRFLNPVSGTTWTYSQNQTIMWTAPGPSDPQNISLLIANVYNTSLLPNYPTPLVLNIPTAQMNFTLTNVSIPVAQGYVILMADIYNSSRIYAQGGFFNVTASTSTGPQGSGFSVASTTTILSGAPAGGPATAPVTASSARRVKARQF